MFGSNCHVFVRRGVGEQMISACVFPTVRHGGGGVMVCDLFRIQGILQQYAIPSGLGLVGLSLIFNRTMTQHISRLCKSYFTKKENDGVLHQMIWPPQSPDLNQIEMVWDESERRVKERQPTSAQHMWELLQ